MEWKSIILVEALPSFTKSLSDKKEDLPPLPEPTLRQRFSHVGRERSETVSAPARSGESTIYSETSIAEVAQAPQVKGLPDLDHARHLLAVSAALLTPAAPTEISSRFYYLVRAGVQAPRVTKAVLSADLWCKEMSAAADAPGVSEGPRDVGEVYLIRQRKRYF